MNGRGGTCRWSPGQRPPAQRVATEMVLDLLIEEACREYGFQMHWWEEGDTRTLELLGPDSPGEYTLTIHKRELVDAAVQDVARRIYWWIVARGRIYSDGQRTIYEL